MNVLSKFLGSKKILDSSIKNKEQGLEVSKESLLRSNMTEEKDAQHDVEIRFSAKSNIKI